MALDSFAPVNLTSLALAAASIALASLVWWRRLARISGMRRNVEKIYALSEQVLDLDPQSAVGRLVESALTGLLEIDSVHFHTEKPREGTQGGVCFPMTFRGEVSGWLELRGPNLKLQSEEASALRHLANQIAIGQALTTQRAFEERLLRSERQGAVGQLISSIAADLRPPLLRLRDAPDHASLERDAAEALSVVDRLLSFARPDREQHTHLDLAAMLRDLLELRSDAMRLALVRVEPGVIEAPLGIRCSRSQLEQALLNVLVFAEQSLSAAQQRILRLTARREGDSALLLFSFQASAEKSAESLLTAARTVVEAHHGAWKMASGTNETVIEVRLPASDALPPSPPLPLDTRPLTLLTAIPDPAVLREITEAASALGHRVVPAASGNDALLLASRFPFDALLSLETLPDIEWSEFSSRARQAVPALVMLNSRGAAPPDGVSAIRLPVDPGELRLLLAALAGKSHPGGPQRTHILETG